MASNLEVDSISKGVTTVNTDEIVDTSNNRIAKAWVNFNGTGTVAIRDSYNVSSITDNGTGDYTVNFATSMSNIGYSAHASVLGSSNTDGMSVGGLQGTTGIRTTSALRFRIFYGPSNSTDDKEYVSLAVFGA